MKKPVIRVKTSTDCGCEIEPEEWDSYLLQCANELQSTYPDYDIEVEAMDSAGSVRVEIFDDLSGSDPIPAAHRSRVRVIMQDVWEAGRFWNES